MAAAAVVVGIAASTYPFWNRVDAAEPRLSRVTIETDPPGAQVLVDGTVRGSTPIVLSLVAGTHTAVVRRGGEERVLPLTLAAGADLVHHLELRADAPAVTTGGITVVTDPPGARVEVDGHQRGTSPLTLSNLAPADYSVTVSTATGSADRRVKVAPGTTTSVVFSLPKSTSPAAGWLVVSSPFDVDILDGGAVVGAGRNVKVMLPAGRHALTLTSGTLKYQANRSIDLASGTTATIHVDAPTTTINVNARPWAEVLLNGKSVGQTPIANLSVPVGTYDIVFRHPQLGERQTTVNVVSGGPNRISMDLTK